MENYQNTIVEDLLEASLTTNSEIQSITQKLVHHTLPRLICEVREVKGLDPVISTTSISGLRVESGTYKLILTLEGRHEEISCEEYFLECLNQDEYKGFIFFLITPSEDKVYSLSIGEVILKNRIVLFKPDDFITFQFCILHMFLENCTIKTATSSIFVQIYTLMKRLHKKISPCMRFENLLFNGLNWILNTLMYSIDHNPFDINFVLPHHILAKLLLNNNPPSILNAIFMIGSSEKYKIPQNVIKCPNGVIKTSPAILNKQIQLQIIKNVLYNWWYKSKEKLTPSSLFIMYK
ncbi:tegument protein UL7 [Canid alphaherpesvirus 1]|nr:tegument protein UL7 [Canid alphaherpesvirus 1]QQL08464.1 tegument protein UL7 [Canid alphaherpesvirus 1]WHU31623.1 tegument protein UL7 [Canid alphaherpesvirus 1]WHU31697.1 tegument protein UL7 [Canid alphaherpesvirus 1]